MTPPKLYGLIGYPVKHSLSPAMHNAAFSHLKINAQYKLFEVKPEELGDFLLKDVFDKDIAGFNITIPHKVKAKEILEKEFPFDENAPKMLENLYYVKLSGAINTVRRDDDKLNYWNTDATGFLKSLEEDLKFETKNKNVLLIGCGGAGRAVIAALSWRQSEIKKIYINDINDEAINSAKEHFSQLPQSTYLMEKLEFVSSERIPEVIQGCQLLINATPVGMKDGDPSVIEKGLLEKNKNLCLYDVVYNRKTQLVKDAQELGLAAVGGLNMLLYQGAHSFEIWTEEKAPVEIMRRALGEALKEVLCK